MANVKKQDLQPIPQPTTPYLLHGIDGVEKEVSYLLKLPLGLRYEVKWEAEKAGVNVSEYIQAILLRRHELMPK